MNLIEVYDELERDGVKLYSGAYGFDNEADAATIKMGNRYAVFFDVLRLRTEKQELRAAVHEQSHIKAGAFINVNASALETQRSEVKARRYEIKERLPFDKMKAAILAGYRSDCELAEYFDEELGLVRDAAEYYTGPCGLSFNS